jgi:enoyl-CoA hydratase/carnithine racemase
MTYQFLLREKREKVALVTLNRPEKRNALSIALRNEIDRCLAETEEDDSVSVVVVTGAGPSFCAGFDRNEFFSQESTDRFHLRLINFPKPIVAAINGPAMGGGLDLAVLCDVRVASENAAFGHPEIKFGAPTLFGPLAEIIGGGLARDLCLSGRRIDAQEAHRIGLVSQVVAADRLLDEAMAVANSIAEAPLATLRAVKTMIVQTYSWSYQEGAGEWFRQLRPPGS